MPRPRGHYATTAAACPSVCPVRDHMSRTEWHNKMEIGRREAHDTADRSNSQRSTVNRPLNTETENAPYLRNGKVCELQLGTPTEYDDPRHRQALTSKVKNVMPSFRRVSVLRVRGPSVSTNFLGPPIHARTPDEKQNINFYMGLN